MTQIEHSDEVLALGGGVNLELMGVRDTLTNLALDIGPNRDDVKKASDFMKQFLDRLQYFAVYTRPTQTDAKQKIKSKTTVPAATLRGKAAVQAMYEVTNKAVDDGMLNKATMTLMVQLKKFSWLLTDAQAAQVKKMTQANAQVLRQMQNVIEDGEQAIVLHASAASSSSSRRRKAENPLESVAIAKQEKRAEAAGGQKKSIVDKFLARR